MGGGDPTPNRRRPPPGLGRVRQGGDPCDLSFTVDLTGTRREAASRLRAGDILEVRLIGRGEGVAAVCAPPGGDPVGTLAGFGGLAALLDCLGRGVGYVAFVEEASPTRCVVNVARLTP